MIDILKKELDFQIFKSNFFELDFKFRLQIIK